MRQNARRIQFIAGARNSKWDLHFNTKFFQITREIKNQENDFESLKNRRLFVKPGQGTFRKTEANINHDGTQLYRNLNQKLC